MVRDIYNRDTSLAERAAAHVVETTMPMTDYFQQSTRIDAMFDETITETQPIVAISTREHPSLRRITDVVDGYESCT